MQREVLILREREISELLEPAACIAAMGQAFAAYSCGRAELPSVIHLDIPEHRGEIHIKTGHIHGNSYYAVKMVSGFPGNTELGLPANGGMVVAFDASTGAPTAFLLDNGLITDIRTAAAGALAAKHLARREVHRVAVIGTGGQARYQMEMLARVRAFRELRVWGRNRDKARTRIEDLQRRGKLPANCQVSVAETVAEAVEDSDIVVTVTASRAPLVRAEWLKLGVTVIAVGSDAPAKQELDVDALARADRIVADSLPQCLRLGEIHHAVEQGAIMKEKVSAELGEIVARQKPGRVSENEIIVCDLTGVGVQDVAAASLVIERAKAAGCGQRISLQD
jgi:ornithine cyclodeaminase/alanine dehydrogenase-like protein (mu-crystallin family)